MKYNTFNKLYTKVGDPVEYINTPEITGWVFWDETWTFPSAAYGTEEEARTALRKYVKMVGRDIMEHPMNYITGPNPFWEFRGNHDQ